VQSCRLCQTNLVPMIQLVCACVAGVCCIKRITSVTLKLVNFVDLWKHFILVYFLASPSFQVPAVCLIFVNQSLGSAAIRFRLPADSCDSAFVVEFVEGNQCHFLVCRFDSSHTSQRTLDLPRQRTSEASRTQTLIVNIGNSLWVRPKSKSFVCLFVCWNKTRKNYTPPKGPPKDGQIALWSATNGSIPDFKYCQVVNWSLLRLLSTYILVSYWRQLNLDIKVTKIFYHWILLLDWFRFWERHFTTYQRFVADQSAISPSLGGYTDVDSDVCKCRCRKSTGFPVNVDGNVTGKQPQKTRIRCWKNAESFVDVYIYICIHTHTHTPTKRLIFQAFSRGKVQKIRDWLQKMSMSIEKTCNCRTYVHVDGSAKCRPDMVDICIHP